MSWDLFAINFPRSAKTMDDIPKGYKPPPLGHRDELIQKIQDIVSTANFTDPSWGIIDGVDWSIELGMGSKPECDSIAFHVRGADPAISVVAAILRHLDLRAFDPQTGELFVDGPEGLNSFHKWRAYRDSAIKKGG